MANKSEKKVKVYAKKKKRTPENEIIKIIQSRYSNIDESKLKKFTDLPLSNSTLKGLKHSEYFDLTDIQRQSISLALKGNDILGAAKTGSGKTLAFVIPVLEILYCNQFSRVDGIGALIITPTRELALQIFETFRNVGRHHDLSVALIIGGKDWKFERDKVDQCNIIICTPGRLLHHMDTNPLFDCNNLKVLVLDEADRCLDMGFQRDMNAIIANLPPERKTLLFSATQTRSVKDLARLSLKDPLYVSVHEHAKHTTPEGLEQTYVICKLEDKIAMLWSFIRNHLKKKSIIFFSTCKQVKFINEAFCRMRPGVSLMALHGALHQTKRMNVYESFCTKKFAVLFATDIAARGLDFADVDWVLQMDCPEDVESYIHRAGRTARLTKGGNSLLVLLPSEEKMVEKLQERKIPITSIAINPERLQYPQRKLEALLARDVALKESAQRAFVAYVKSVCLMKDKSVFNVHALNTDAFSKSLGLAISPKIRFLQRMGKKSKQNQSSKENKKESTDDTDKLQTNSNAQANEEDESDESSEEDELKDFKNKAKTCLKQDNDFASTNINDNDDDDDDSDDDFLTVKRKNVEIDDLPFEELEEDISSKFKQKKAVTKAAVVKKILKKKIVANKKINFDEDGQEVTDPTKSKISALGKEYEQEDDATGLDIEKAKIILKEEDKFDKQRYREKIKQKHQEEKRKIKAEKKAAQEEGRKMKIGKKGAQEENESDEGSDAESFSSYEGPDLSFLPDPDELYGKQENSDEEDNGSDKQESDESSQESEEEPIHRPQKRKLITQKEHNKKKRKHLPSISDNDHLQADEELALQLLRNS